jgi:hexulose-6-phosphate isomerase
MLVKAINIWSYPGGLEGTLAAREALELAKAHGFEGVELCLGYDGPLSLDLNENECGEIRRMAEDMALRLDSIASGTYWSRAVGDVDEVTRNLAKGDLRQMIRIAGWLGAKTLLTIPGAVDVFFLPDRPKQAIADVMGHALSSLHELAPDAAAHDVRLGIENVWNRMLLTPTEMARFIDEIGTPNVGAYVDVANALPFGYAEDWLRTLGRRVVGVHFKDYRRAVGTADGFVDLLEGDVNWPEVVAALAEIGYEGPVAAEMIPRYAHHPLVRVENASRAMDAILGR